MSFVCIFGKGIANPLGCSVITKVCTKSHRLVSTYVSSTLLPDS